jgi:hypothetical protein
MSRTAFIYSLTLFVLGLDLIERLAGRERARWAP